MSLFDDDFYSTRASRRDSWRMPRSFPRRLPAWMLPAVSGAAVTAVLFVLFSGNGAVDRAADAKSVALMVQPSPGAATSGSAGGSAGAGSGASSANERMMSDSVVGAAEKVYPTVVSILGSKREGEKDTGRGGTVGIGSGVIFERVGDKVRIVTNNHVVEGFTQLEVITISGERRKASLIGRDQITDLAVIETDGNGLKQVAEFGDSDTLRAGETAIAVGNPLGLGSAPTVTKGIISWPKRTIPVSLGREGEFDWEMDVIQTDAAINSGNSGGALVNLDGKVVGINTLKVADTGIEGLGFAIPINQVKAVIQSLITDHKVTRPYIGVVTQDLQSFAGTESLKLPKEVKRGIIVLEAVGPAKDAGLKTSDVIVELDGKAIDSTLSLRKYIYGTKKVGEKLAITYYRAGKKNTVQVKLGELNK